MLMLSTRLQSVDFRPKVLRTAVKDLVIHDGVQMFTRGLPAIIASTIIL